jgi:hypothetical protein
VRWIYFQWSWRLRSCDDALAFSSSFDRSLTSSDLLEVDDLNGHRLQALVTAQARGRWMGKVGSSDDFSPIPLPIWSDSSAGSPSGRLATVGFVLRAVSNGL